MTRETNCVFCGEAIGIDSQSCPRCDAVVPTASGIEVDVARELALGGWDETAFRMALQANLSDAYVVRRVVGFGGSAIVYAAWDANARRMVAIKALRPDLRLTTGYVERFHREVVAAAAISHPNVMPVFAAGPPDSPPFMVMPLILGETLTTLLHREGTLSVPETCRLVACIAEGLHAAHTSGHGAIVHRDVKPDNILIESGSRRPIITDFGVAKINVPNAERLTHTGVIVGTLRYMSPEQAWGVRDVDHRSDQFSLSTVAYECLVGAPPFDAGSLLELQARHASYAPPSVEQFRPDVPVELSDAIARALSLERERRFDNMRQFAQSIEDAGLVFASRMKSALLHHRARRSVRLLAARAAVGRWKRTALLAAIIGLFCFVGVRMLEPKAMYAIGGHRAEALFAARSALDGVGGAPASRSSETLKLWVDDSLHQYFADLLGFDSTDVLEKRTLPVLTWVYQRYEWKTGQLSTVEIGPNGRITMLRRPQEDAPAHVDLTERGNLAAALLTLIKLNVDTTGLLLVRHMAWNPNAQEWVEPTGTSIGYWFRWARPDWLLRHGANSIRTTYDVALNNGRAYQFNESLAITGHVAYRPDEASTLGSWYLESVPLLLVLGLITWTLTFGRKGLKFDWHLAIPVGAVWMAYELLELFDSEPVPIGSDFGSTALRMMGLGATYATGIAFVVVGGVVVMLMIGAAEMLSRDREMTGFEPLADMGRGVLSTPELPVACLVGFATAGMLLGARALAEFFTWIGPGGGEVSLPGVLQSAAPGLTGIADLGRAVGWTIPIVILSAFFRRFSSVALACVVVGVLALLFNATSTVSWVTRLERIGLSISIVLLTDQFGVLTSLTTVWLVLVFSDSLALIRTGRMSSIAAALVSISPFVLCALLASRSWKQPWYANDSQGLAQRAAPG